MKPIKQVYVPPDGPPRDIKPNPEIFVKMGTDNIYKMVSDFYYELNLSSIRHLFPENWEEASKKSAAFFVFILGGPPLYHQQYGPPMMRQRHLPFAIDDQARQVWLDCFKKTLADAEKKYGFPLEHMQSFWTFLDKFSAWMVNKR